MKLSKRALQLRGIRIAAAIKRNQANASTKDHAIPGRILVQFPEYPSHESASCFNCGSDLDGYWSKSDYAPGRGAFVQKCCKCNLSTWYDVKESES